MVVTGPESSGKSTLCAALAARIGTNWVPEYARNYLEEGRQINIREERELLRIAQGQLEAEDSAAMQANEWLICDTDLHMVRIWGETMYGRCHHRILAKIAERSYNLYVLSFPDIPWVADPLRGYPDYKDRHYFYLQYLDMVVNSGLPFIILRGTPEERIGAVLNAIRNM